MAQLLQVHGTAKVNANFKANTGPLIHGSPHNGTLFSLAFCTSCSRTRPTQMLRTRTRPIKPRFQRLITTFSPTALTHACYMYICIHVCMHACMYVCVCAFPLLIHEQL